MKHYLNFSAPIDGKMHEFFIVEDADEFYVIVDNV